MHPNFIYEQEIEFYGTILEKKTIEKNINTHLINVALNLRWPCIHILKQCAWNHHNIQTKKPSFRDE